MTTRSELTMLIRAYEERGYTVVHGTKHWKVMLNGSMVTTLPATPGEGRAMYNCLADFRRLTATARQVPAAPRERKPGRRPSPVTGSGYTQPDPERAAIGVPFWIPRPISTLPPGTQSLQVPQCWTCGELADTGIAFCGSLGWLEGAVRLVLSQSSYHAAEMIRRVLGPGVHEHPVLVMRLHADCGSPRIADGLTELSAGLTRTVCERSLR